MPKGPFELVFPVILVILVILVADRLGKHLGPVWMPWGGFLRHSPDMQLEKYG
jgi:hypothetical protein